MLGGERAAVQNPFIRYAVEAGWTYLPPDEALRLRGGESGLLLRSVFIERVQRLNPGFVDVSRAEDLIRRLERVLPRIEGNLDAWEYLKGLKTVFVPEEKRERNVRLMEARDWQANAFHVTDELRFDNGVPPAIRQDIAFFINGVPVLVVETKSATKPEGIAEALDQIRDYHRDGPELMALMQVAALTHLVRFYYGPTWNLSRKNLFNWKEESAAPDFETLVKTFIHPQRIVRVISDFILFTRRDDELTKVILRPHQMRAAERVVRRAADAKKRRGLVWHTQGSGKTYTMITVAKRLIEEPVFENPTVLMLVDRNELETQLFGNLAACGIEHCEVAGSKRGLRRLLAQDRRGLIVSMIHKFDDIPADLNKRHNIFVLVDEAHRTTSGDLGNYLMGALPNATYIGFTGTPIDKTAYGRGTFKVFGTDDPQGYLDKYGIAESIEDGTTVPLHYTLAPNELRVDRDVLDREFLDLAAAEGLSDPDELEKILERAVTLKTMLKKPERVVAVAAYIAEHFRDVVEPMGYKAFVVGVDREACAMYKDALDEHLPAEYSCVVYSPGHNDRPELRRYHLAEDAEKQVRKAFRKPDQLPKILIVTEKLLTGFDAPILYCMYLDKPMRDHVLLQAIARVNRPYEDEHGRTKPAGFVLDFVGIFEKLEKALAFDSKDVSAVIQDIDILKVRFAELMEYARGEHLPLAAGKSGDKAAEAVLEHFRDEEVRHEFYGFFKHTSAVYEILSPDPFLRPYLEDYERLAEMYQLVRSAYDPGVIVDREILRKTALLVQKHTETSDIGEALEVYPIDKDTLDRIAASQKPDTVKVFNLLKSLQEAIGGKIAGAPYLLSIGERAERIAEEYEQRQITTQEALRRLEALVREFTEAERDRAERGLPPEAFAVYWELRQAGVSDPQAVAEAMAKAFSDHPYWAMSEQQERAVRTELYKALLAAGATTGNVAEIAQRIMTVMLRSRR